MNVAFIQKLNINLLYTTLVVTFLLLLISVAYFILAECKILGAIQRRQGPNVIGVLKLLHFLMNSLKLFFKETIILCLSNNLIFIISPILIVLFDLLYKLKLQFFNYNYILEKMMDYQYINLDYIYMGVIVSFFFKYFIKKLKKKKNYLYLLFKYIYFNWYYTIYLCLFYNLTV